VYHVDLNNNNNNNKEKGINLCKYLNIADAVKYINKTVMFNGFINV